MYCYLHFVFDIAYKLQGCVVCGSWKNNFKNG